MPLLVPRARPLSQNPPLHVRCFGSGPPLLLIHGLGSSGDDWAFQIPPLAERHQLIVPDLSGCGRSPARGTASIAGWAQELLDWLGRRGIDQVAVIGYSMGGAVALEMALQAPSRVQRLATINSLPSYRVDHWRKWLELNLQVAMVKVLGLPRTARMIAGRLFPHPHQSAMRQRVIDVVGSSPVEPYLRSARALADWCAAERCAAFATPMLMLAGEHDYTSLAEKHAWAQRLGAQIAVVAGSRHGTPFDAIAATNAALLAFLAGQQVPEMLAVDTPQTTPTAPPVLPPEVHV